MNCQRGSVFRGQCVLQLNFNREGKVEATYSSRYSTKLRTISLIFLKVTKRSYSASIYIKLKAQILLVRVLS